MRPMTTYTPPTPEQVDEINATVRYAAYSVFRAAAPLPHERDGLVAEVEQLFAELGDEGLVVRGVYDVSGLRADADVMIWWHAEQVETVQRAYQRFRRTELGRHLDPVWSVMGLHRPAEFNRGHVPAFLSGHEPGRYLCVYPFVRSYEWYIPDPAERGRMLREHGQAAADY